MKLLRDVDCKGKVVFLRADFNVPVKNGEILDDHRIIKTLPTINHLLDSGAKQVLIATHFGRPKGKVDDEYRVEPIANRLRELLSVDVGYVTDCLAKVGPEPVIMLENTRFYAEETKNDAAFAKKLAHNADVFVFDAFGAAHRDHASTTGIISYVKESCVGFLVAKEVKMLSLKEPARPLVAIVGAAKVSDKIPVLEGLLQKVDKLLLGGALVFTFFKAQGFEVGTSLVEDEMIPVAKKLMQEHADKIVLPSDIVISEESEGSEIFTVEPDKIPPNMKGLDIGDDSIHLFEEHMKNAQTIFWNGPLGLFEIPPFDHATREIAEYLSQSRKTVIIGGGDTERAVSEFSDSFSHVSTGGGAALELVSGKALVVLEKLQ